MSDAARPDVNGIIHRVIAEKLRFPVVIALCRIRVGGLPLDDLTIRTVAAAFSKQPNHVAELADWVASLVRPTPDARPLYICESVSCCARGAKELHDALLPELEAMGCPRSVRRVHCLDQCEYGPSVDLDGRIYVGGEECIRRDERPWRSEPFVHGEE